LSEILAAKIETRNMGTMNSSLVRCRPIG